MEGLHQEYGVQNYDNGVEFWFTLDTGHMAGIHTEGGEG